MSCPVLSCPVQSCPVLSCPVQSYPVSFDSVLLDNTHNYKYETSNTLSSNAMHSDVRYVLDLTDHVWSEIWIPELDRYVHIDPCERAFDKPLMYESGWNKKLTHVISFSRCGVVNATPRYTRSLGQVILRRSSDADTRCCIVPSMEITCKNSNILKNTQIPLPPPKYYMATSFYLSFF